MPFELPIGYKFSCFALESVGLDVRHHGPMDLGDGLWVVFEPPFQLDGAWREWLGSIEADRLRQCNVALLAISPSDRPQVLDDENFRLRVRAHSLFYALFMVEIFRHEGGIILDGANVDGRVEVRQIARLEEHFAPSNFYPEPLRGAHFWRMARVAEGIRAIYSPEAPSSRLQRGFHAWIRGVQERYGDERLHQFVRAIEAVISPSEGKGKRHFKYRCQLFVGESAQNEGMLADIVSMRGSAEHLNALVAALEQHPKENRAILAQQRLCQAQLLANFIYECILSDAALRGLFAEDDKIEAFWQKKRAEQIIEWGGGRLDWVRGIAARFVLDYPMPK
jgi:hypothetical protein